MDSRERTLRIALGLAAMAAIALVGSPRRSPPADEGRPPAAAASPASPPPRPFFRPSREASRPLAPSVVPAHLSRDDGWLPVPQGEPADPLEPLRIAPARSGVGFSRALLPEELLIPLDHPEARYLAEPIPADPRGGHGLFDFPASPEQASGRFYVATPAGVFEVEVAGLHLVVRGGQPKGGPYRASLLLRPDPGAGGFLFSSPSRAAFRARTLRASPEGRVSGTSIVDVSAEPAGAGILLRTHGPRLQEASRVLDVDAWALASATLVEASPGGSFLLVTWRRGQQSGRCADALLLRPSDLEVVARHGCDVW